MTISFYSKLFFKIFLWFFSIIKKYEFFILFLLYFKEDNQYLNLKKNTLDYFSNYYRKLSNVSDDVPSPIEGSREKDWGSSWKFRGNIDMSRRSKLVGCVSPSTIEETGCKKSPTIY